MSKFSKMKKRVLASVLCAVITLSSNVMVFADGEESSVTNQESSAIVEETLVVNEDGSGAVEESFEVVEESSEVVEESSEAVEESFEVAEESSEAVEESSEAVEETSEVAEESSKAVEETSEVAEETSEAVEESSEVVEETSEAVEESSEAVEETSEAVEESSEVVEETSEAVEESSEAVEESSEVVEESSEAVEESSEAVEESSEVVEESSEAVEETSKVTEDGGHDTGVQENAQAGATLMEQGAEQKATEVAEEVEKQVVGTVELTEKIDGITITLSGLSTSFEPGKKYTLSVAKIEDSDAAKNENYEVIDDKEVIEAVEEAVNQIAEEKEKVATNYQAYDIKLMADGVEVQPLGPVEVKFSGKEVTKSVKDEETETSVIHVDTETKQVEDMEAEVTKENGVAIETNHFSIYVFIELEEIEKVTLTVEHWVKTVEDGEYEKANDAKIELPNKFVGNLEDLIAICVSDEYDDEDLKLEQIYIEEDGVYRKVNDEEILTITKDTKIKLEYFVEYEKAVQLNIFSKPTIIKPENTVNKDKTADGLDENDQTNVTLSVGGEEENLGVDIIYILGRGIAVEEIETDVMLNCLMDTFREIIKEGTQVNFGMVPFAYTDEVVLELTPLRTEEDLEALPEKMAIAFERADISYDGVNMENALDKAKKMFESSDLRDHPERQHLIMISSGHTYFFNGGENNEYISTVPVRFKQGTLDSNAIFYSEKAWMRARNNSTNSYPIPKKITEAYNKEQPEGITLWEYYWNYIDMWARADIAAGDTGRYDVATVASGNGSISGAYHSNQSSFKYSGYGAVVANPSQEALDNTYVFDMKQGGTNYGPNPLTNASVAHAISYERAMWEAYNFVQDEITGEGISFYPIYQPLRANGSCSNDGPIQYYDWTGKQIGHCFVNMLAGGEAVVYSSTDNKAFFDPIKRSILYSISAGSSVEDYIGYDEVKGNFDFIQEVESIDINNVINMSVYVADEELDQLDGVKDDKIKYVTVKLDTPTEGATSTYTFTRPGSEEPTFTLDYYYGNGTTTERFVWTFGEHISKFNPVTLTYKLQLKDKVPSESVTEETTFVVDTNINATLYPVNSDYNKRNPEVFPIPNVEYTVVPPTKLIHVEKVDETNFDIKLEGAGFAVYQLDEVSGEYVQIDFDPETPGIDGITTDVTGIAEFEIRYGTYKVKEIVAPDGYAISDIEHTIVYDKNGVSVDGQEVSEVDGVITVQVADKPLYELPATGANGFYLYTLSGVVLMIGAALVLYKNKRKEVM